MQDNSALKNLASCATIVVAIIAAIALIPQFGIWLSPKSPADPAATSSPVTDIQSPEPEETATQNVEVIVEATSTTPPPTKPPFPEITVHNRLVRPARLYIDDIMKGEIAATGVETLILDSSPVRLRFEVINPHAASGELLGDPMSGVFEPVSAGSVVTITNRIEDNLFFVFMLSNNSDRDCDIVVDDGYESVKRPGRLLARAANVSAGYYRLYNNSNIVLYCPEMVGWWGIRPGQDVTEASITEIVEPETGVMNGSFGP